MAHGSNCDCGLCILGKKMGIISSDSEGPKNAGGQGTCPTCNHEHKKEDSGCDCGCK